MALVCQANDTRSQATPAFAHNSKGVFRHLQRATVLKNVRKRSITFNLPLYPQCNKVV